MRTAPAKTMRNNFVAKVKAKIPIVSSIIPVSFWTPKCCNYLLTAKQQKESHYSRNEAMLPRGLVPPKNENEKKSRHMIKCLLTERGRAGRENIWLSVRTHGPRCPRSLRHDLEPNIFPSGPLTQSISTYYQPL